MVHNNSSVRSPLLVVQLSAPLPLWHIPACEMVVSHRLYVHVWVTEDCTNMQLCIPGYIAHSCKCKALLNGRVRIHACVQYRQEGQGSVYCAMYKYHVVCTCMFVHTCCIYAHLIYMLPLWYFPTLAAYISVIISGFYPNDGLMVATITHVLCACNYVRV